MTRAYALFIARREAIPHDGIRYIIAAGRVERQETTGTRPDDDQLAAGLAASLRKAEEASAVRDAGRTAWQQREEKAVSTPEKPVSLAAPVTDLWPDGTGGGLATMARNSLLRAGILTVGDLVRTETHDLMDLRNFGVGNLAEVRRVLLAAGLALAGEEPQP